MSNTREINIDIVRGYYEENRDPSCGCVIDDPARTFSGDLWQHCNLLASCADVDGYTSLLEGFYHRHKNLLSKDYQLKVNFVDETDIISGNDEKGNVDVGYIYLRASLYDMQIFPIGSAIYLRLFAPQGNLVLLNIYPRSILNAINTDIFSTDQAVRHLICIPHPVNPGDIMTVPYFDYNCIRTTAYQCRKEDQYYYKDIGRIILPTAHYKEEAETCE